MHTHRQCFHCQEPVESDLFISQVGNQEAHFCCRGCQAVAELLYHDGLDEFYRYRESGLNKPEPLNPEDLAFYRLHDRNDILERISQKAGDDTERKMQMGIEGITCAACVWLLETRVRKIPGVREFWLSLSQHRAELIWDSSELPLSEIFVRIHELGFRPYPFSESEHEKRLAKEQKQTLLRIGIAGIGMMQNMMLAIPVYLGLPEVSGPEFQKLFWFVSLLMAIPVVFFSARPFFQAASRDIRTRHLSMDTPVSIAIGGAFIASAYVTIFGGEEVYFDSVCMFTFFLLIGRYLESQTRLAATRGQQKLQQSTPELVNRITGEGAGDQEMVLLEDIQPGDHIRLKPGDMIPTDGCILEGTCSVNEAAITGEFNPRRKLVGDAVLSGSFLLDATIQIKVTRKAEDSNLSALTQLVDRALAEKPRQVATADRVASYFVVGVLLTAVIVSVSWLLVDPARAFPITLAVLVATCPCALSLATPTAITAATQALRNLGFVITRPHVLQSLAESRHILFDKTGTLTSGQYGLLALENASDRTDLELLALAGALEKDSPHPIARFFAIHSEPAFAPDAIQHHVGAGVEGTLAQKRIRLGSREFCGLAEEESEPPETGAKPVYLCEDERLLATFWLMDTWRSGTSQLLQGLQHELQIRSGLLTGDPSADAASLKKRLGIEEVHTNVRPEEKLRLVQEANQSGPTIMVGDGLNDVPAMASAHLSIAVGEASDLTRMKADALLLNNDITLLLPVIRQARQCQRIIRQNIAWSIGYNASILPLAALGWVAPWVAALGMSSSSLIVVFNALRLRKVRPLG